MVHNHNLIIALLAHQPYLTNTKNDTAEEQELLFAVMADTYMPLLQMFFDLEAEQVPFKLMMCISPAVCVQLKNQTVQDNFIAWLDKLILFAQAECVRYSAKSQESVLAKLYLKKLEEKKQVFINKYQKNLIAQFARFAEQGNIELLATAATFAYLPHYADIKEAVAAQIETGLVAHREYFSVNPEGFWLPYMGYACGVESMLRSYGFHYSILDSHGLLFATPVPSKGVFAPVSTSNGFSFFARDYETPSDIFEEPGGYIYDDSYRNQERDAGFEAPLEHIEQFLDENKRRIPTGFKYWTRNALYVPEIAMERVKIDAVRFLDEKAKKLKEASKLCKSSVSLVCSFDVQTFGQKWYEGFDWLASIFRETAKRTDISLVQCSAVLKAEQKKEKILPFPSAALGSGYGEDLLDNSNDWMLRYIRKAIERMVDLTERFPNDTGLKERSLNFAAKEVLLSMSSDMPRMLHDKYFSSFAAHLFRQYIASFTTVYDSLGSNAISTEWLTRMEKAHSIFPWLNYRVFSKKK